MTPEKLDLLFPYVVAGYGITMTLVLNTPLFMEIAEQRFPYALNQQIKGHRGLALICLVVGSLWSLQNLWL